MLNHIVLMGRLGSDPEQRVTASGVPVTTVNLAVTRDFADKSTGQKETDWIPVVAWRETANFLADYFTKGRMAVVSGRLQIRSWTDKDGNKRKTAEVIAENVYFADSKSSAQEGNTASAPSFGSVPAQEGYAWQVAPAQDYAQIDGEDEALPF